MKSSIKILHSARATATGGRGGTAVTSDGALAVHFAPPRTARNDGAVGQTPEHLYAAGFSASFLEAIQRAAAYRKAALAADSTVTAEVALWKRSDGSGDTLDVGLVVSLPEVDPVLARDLVKEARMLCAYANATRDGFELRVTVS